MKKLVLDKERLPRTRKEDLIMTAPRSPAYVLDLRISGENVSQHARYDFEVLFYRVLLPLARKF